MMGVRTAMLAAFAILVIAGCSTESRNAIHSETFDRSWSGHKYNNLLAMALYEDSAFRIASESIFVAEARRRGINATPSYNVFPDLASLSSTSVLTSKLAEGGYDGVVSVATLEEGEEFDVEAYQTKVALMELLVGRSTFTRIGGSIDHYKSGEFVLDVGLWDARSLARVWEATTDSYSLDSDTESATQVSNFVLDSLTERGFVGP